MKPEMIIGHDGIHLTSNVYATLHHLTPDQFGLVNFAIKYRGAFSLYLLASRATCRSFLRCRGRLPGRVDHPRQDHSNSGQDSRKRQHSTVNVDDIATETNVGTRSPDEPNPATHGDAVTEQ